MIAATYPRSISTLIILVGAAAFAVGLTTMFFRGPTPGARAQAVEQTDCVQPSEDGCWVALDVPVQAILNDPSVAHNWLVDIPEGMDFSVAAANLPADLQLWVYGPDGSLLHHSNKPGYLDEIVQVSNAGAGAYWIVVDSPGGEAGNDPYTLLATPATLSTEPLDPYANPQFILPY